MLVPGRRYWVSERVRGSGKKSFVSLDLCRANKLSVHFYFLNLLMAVWWVSEYQRIQRSSNEVCCLVNHLKCKSQVMNWGENQADMIEEFRVVESQSSRVTTSNESLGVQTDTNLHITGSRASGAQQLLPISQKKRRTSRCSCTIKQFFLFLIWQIEITTIVVTTTVIQSIFHPQTPANVFQLLTRESHLSISKLFARLLFAELQLDAADLKALHRQKEEEKNKARSHTAV